LAIEVVKLLIKLLTKLYQTGPKIPLESHVVSAMN
jgi:hypothetical protein